MSHIMVTVKMHENQNVTQSSHTAHSCGRTTLFVLPYVPGPPQPNITVKIEIKTKTAVGERWHYSKF